jgi:diguanylate cyclase (GGDEF)-like protein
MIQVLKEGTLVSLLLTGRRGMDVRICKVILEEHARRFQSVLYANSFGAIMVACAFWLLNPEIEVLSWLFLMGAIFTGFHLIGRRLPAVSSTTTSVDSTQLLFYLAFAVALGLGWGTGGVLFFAERLEYEMFLAMVVCCVAVVGATAFSTFLIAAELFILCVMVPGIARLIESNLVFFHVLGFAGIAYCAIAMWFALVASRTGLRGFTLSHRNSELVAALQESNKELENKNTALHYALAKIEEVATKDELTGCFNRRYLMESLRRESDISSRDYRAFTLLLIDIDHFKSVNDTHGHLVGDRVLADLAETLRQTMRSMDTLARFGGEEFACMLPGTTLEEAGILADRIRHVISTLSFALDETRLTVTISIGVAQWHCHETIESVIQRADQALYKAKAAGRNCIALAESPSSGLALVASN